MNRVVIRHGLKNLPEAIDIRSEVFIKEQGYVHEFDETDQTADEAVVYCDKIPVATGRMFPKEQAEGTYIIGRIAVLKEYRKQHLGSYLIAKFEEKAKKMQANEIELSAQMQAKPFYERIGYESCGEIYLDEDRPHICMKKKL